MLKHLTPTQTLRPSLRTRARRRSPPPRRRRRCTRPRAPHRTQQRCATRRRGTTLHRRAAAETTRVRAATLSKVILVRSERQLLLRVAAGIAAVVAGRSVARDARAVGVVGATDEVEVCAVGFLVVGGDDALQGLHHAVAELGVYRWW